MGAQLELVLCHARAGRRMLGWSAWAPFGTPTTSCCRACWPPGARTCSSPPSSSTSSRCRQALPLISIASANKPSSAHLLTNADRIVLDPFVNVECHIPPYFLRVSLCRGRLLVGRSCRTTPARTRAARARGSGAWATGRSCGRRSGGCAAVVHAHSMPVTYLAGFLQACLLSVRVSIGRDVPPVWRRDGAAQRITSGAGGCVHPCQSVRHTGRFCCRWCRPTRGRTSSPPSTSGPGPTSTR
jgi:hypothetical protein